MKIAAPDDESMVNVNDDPRLQAPSQLVTSLIRVGKTCDSDQRYQRIWNVRRKLILVIWVMLLPVIAFVEFSTVAWHAWIKNKFGYVIVIQVGKHMEGSLQVTIHRICEEGRESCHRVIDVAVT